MERPNVVLTLFNTCVCVCRCVLVSSTVGHVWDGKKGGFWTITDKHTQPIRWNLISVLAGMHLAHKSSTLSLLTDTLTHNSFYGCI